MCMARRVIIIKLNRLKFGQRVRNIDNALEINQYNLNVLDLEITNLERRENRKVFLER